MRTEALRPFPKRRVSLLFSFGRSVLASFWENIDGQKEQALGEYFEGVFRKAPRRIQAIHFLGALALQVLPVVLLKKPKFLFQLNLQEKTRYFEALLKGSYVFRVLFLFFRNASLTAVSHPAGPAYTRKVRTTPLLEESPLPEGSDYIVVGSGAAGSAASLTLSQLGAETLVLEEGGPAGQSLYEGSLYSVMSRWFRDWGFQTANGKSSGSRIPLLQGRAVGGTTVMNGGILHHLPEDAYEAWVKRGWAGPSLKDIHAQEEKLALRLQATESRSGRWPVDTVLQAMGWKYQNMWRNAPDCQGTGRCLQGCPTGAKLSMEASFLPEAVGRGLRLASGQRVVRIEFNGQRATGVWVEDGKKQKRFIKAGKAVVLACGAIQSPALLWRSGIRPKALGEGFHCHLSLSVLGLLKSLQRQVEGPPQGLEITEFKELGFKLASQSVPLELLLAKTRVYGEHLETLVKEQDRLTSWMANLVPQAMGRIRFGWNHSQVYFDPTSDDLVCAWLAMEKLCELLFALGAQVVYPGLLEGPRYFESLSQFQASRFHLKPTSFLFGAGHLFGGAALSGDSEQGVVAPDFSVYGTKNVYCIDASVFPSAIGVNPQLTIMALARLAATAIESEKSR